MSSLKRKYEEIDSDNENLNHQTLLSEADISQHEIALTATELKVAKHEIFILKNKNNLSDEQLAQHEIKLAAGKLDVAKHEIFILTHKNKLLDHQLRELKSDNQHPQPALSMTDDSSQQLDQLLLDNDSLRSTVSELQRAREQLLKKENDSTALSQQNDQLLLDNTILQNTVDEMRRQISNKDNEAAASLQQLNKLKHTIDELSSHLSDRERSEDALSTRVDVLSKQITEMEARESKFQERIVSLSPQVSQQRKELPEPKESSRELSERNNQIVAQSAELNQTRQHEKNVRQEVSSSRSSVGNLQPRPSESHASRTYITIEPDTVQTSVDIKPTNQHISNSHHSNNRFVPHPNLISLHSLPTSSAWNQSEALYSPLQLRQVPHVQSFRPEFKASISLEASASDNQMMMTPQLKQRMDKVHLNNPRFRFNTDCDTSPFKLCEKVHVLARDRRNPGIVLAIAHTDQVVDQLKQLQHDQFIRGIPVSVKSLPPHIELSAHHKYCYVVGWSDDQSKSLPPVFVVEPAIHRRWITEKDVSKMQTEDDIVKVILGCRVLLTSVQKYFVIRAMLVGSMC